MATKPARAMIRTHLGRPAATTPSKAPMPRRRMAALLGSVVMSWVAEGMIAAVLPLVILDGGAGPGMVGVVAAFFAIPTLLLRPLTGARIDASGHRRFTALGGLLVSVAPIGYLTGTGLPVIAARLVQGTGWALFSSANNVLLAHIAPPGRRGEASAYFNVMWSLGFVLGPPIGLVLYSIAGPPLVFPLASALAVGAFLCAWDLRDVHTAVGSTEAPDRARGGLDPAASLRGSLEPTAVATMVVLGLLMTAQTLFLGFAPVYARETGVPIEQLALLYPLYGGTLAVAQLTISRLVDRVGRASAVIAAASLAAAGLGLAAAPLGLAGYAIGAVVFATANAIAGPTLAATTIERAPPPRLGAAMATFSVGYQIAAGGGGAIWGAVVDVAGYPWPFAAGIVFQFLAGWIAWRSLRHHQPVRPSHTRLLTAREGESS